MRTLALSLASLMVGCTCGAEPPASVAAPPASVAPVASAVEPPPSSAPPATRTAPPAAAATPAEIQAQVRTLRAARAAVHAHDAETAARLFDELLRSNARSPRILCEAGYVSHLVGRDAQAATRIDLALELFGPDAALPADLRVPAAMCLYNRGLVAEARHDVATAAASWQRSLALRPNATVSARLAQLATDTAGRPPDDGDEDDGTVGGLAVRAGERSVLVATTDSAALLRALASGLAGEDWEGAGITATVRVRATVPLSGGAYARAVAIDVDDGSAMLANVSYAFAFEERSGYRVVTVPVGEYDSTDHGHTGGCEGTALEVDVVSGLFRARYDVVCDETSEDEVPDPEGRDDVSCYESSDAGEETSSHVILCALDTEPDCLHFATASERTQEPSDTVRCFDANDAEVPAPAAPSGAHEALRVDAYEYTLDVLADRRVRVAWTSEPRTPPQGEHAWSELRAWSDAYAVVGAPDLRFDDEQDAEDGEEEGEEEEYGEE